MKTFWIGIAISAFYFIGLVITIHGLGLTPMSSWNEFGDFLAGAFSPIAFLWLILGYLQQQRELQQNTRALEIQAEELKNSVEQYKAMVKVANEQLLSDREMLISAKSEKEAQFKPRIRAPIISPAMIIGGGRFVYNTEIENAGAQAIQVHILTEPEFKLFNGVSIHSLKEGKTSLRHGIEFNQEDLLDTFAMTIRYESALGIPYSDTYVYKRGQSGKYSVIDSTTL